MRFGDLCIDLLGLRPYPRVLTLGLGGGWRSHGRVALSSASYSSSDPDLP